MDITADMPRTERTIAEITVQVPQPYAAGQPLTEATAAMLNQTFAENISNNMRSALKLGHVADENSDPVPHTTETAQAAVDRYIAEYEPGVRRGGSGEARVTDPIEREARKLARTAATELVKANGLKTKDVDMAEVTGKVFDANREALMARAKKIVAEAKKAGDALNLDGLLGGGEGEGSAE